MFLIPRKIPNIVLYLYNTERIIMLIKSVNYFQSFLFADESKTRYPDKIVFLQYLEVFDLQMVSKYGISCSSTTKFRLKLMFCVTTPLVIISIAPVWRSFVSNSCSLISCLCSLSSYSCFHISHSCSFLSHSCSLISHSCSLISHSCSFISH